MQNNKKSLNKGKKIVKNIINFLLANIIVGMCVSIPLVYYGPLKNVREMMVTTAMTTFKHRYFATFFLTDKEINEILERNKANDDKNSNVSDIKVLNNRETTNEKSTDGITFEEIKKPNFKAYMLQIKDSKRVELGLTDSLNKYGITLDEMAKKNNAVAGINAGGFVDVDGQGNGGVPTGFVMKDGKIVFNEIPANDKISLIGFNYDGILTIGKYTLKQIESLKIKDAVSFGPFFVVNGKPTIESGNGGIGIQPRTVIGQKKDGTVLMLVVDGRQINSVGATGKEVQDLMLEYGAYNAANLDGGSSTTMFFDGKIKNSPSSKDGLRFLPTAFLVK
ncbi:Exopolysaccharide biosynthesis protein [Clostridium cavendishii DSM 21758]|uniref:Exopolysaccharide biosynthesis protein n=1 Tax=Clostridium cavendishii DSM 21758 TaxID=1121302 RepID=A0A1M6F578_9CLOT|nr:phosphodiester glycosidase family protein [Clostridium cavendishii]SHI92823.1 Exopolysaccharide biosynthesis protein [Clostridium cavendishii DSM 21758]